jgi:hypothetical protein
MDFCVEIWYIVSKDWGLGPEELPINWGIIYNSDYCGIPPDPFS